MFRHLLPVAEYKLLGIFIVCVLFLSNGCIFYPLLWYTIEIYYFKKYKYTWYNIHFCFSSGFVATPPNRTSRCATESSAQNSRFSTRSADSHVHAPSTSQGSLTRAGPCLIPRPPNQGEWSNCTFCRHFLDLFSLYSVICLILFSVFFSILSIDLGIVHL